MSELDRLIDEGLNRYGSGDLDGALEAWEEALAIDPDNAQANSYVDYVRQNYDILATDGGTAVGDAYAPFGIEPEPEYTIEILEGEVGPAISEPTLEDLDGGWFIDDDDPLTVHVGRAPSRDDPGKSPKGDDPGKSPKGDDPTKSPNGNKPRTLELEADEPPAGGISFDETTREYVNQKPPPDEFADEPSSFRAEATPLGFGAQDTEIRPRNTGFVQPVANPQPPVPSPGGEPPTNTPELRVRVRTPSSMPPIIKPAEPPVTPPSTPPPSMPPSMPASTPTATPMALDLEPLDLAPLELAPVDRTPTELSPPSGMESTDDDLLAAPIPRRVTPVRGSQPNTSSPADSEPARIPTRELPAPRPPASAGDVSLATATTRDLARDGAELTDVAHAPIGGDDPVIGIPTRELGLRPPTSKRPSSVFPDEDATTTQSDARQIRREAAAAAERRRPDRPGRPDRDTRRDANAQPVAGELDARGAQILAEIDDGVTADESKDDHVRRRISALIMRAAEWNAAGELDKAVTAVDLALSEDPTSALAQKLLHRNRDAIMTVFQTYLGDLERQPQLAKPLHELAQTPIGSRAAFLLSRIDGMLSIDEILDVSGMPRLEAYRHLCQLFLRGILR